jgi:uncharacterized OsmC-like protein
MTEREEIIRAGVRHREAATEPATIRGLENVEIRVASLLTYEAQARGEHGVMHVGEPVDRGGDGSGASPLAHFLTACGACLLNQFVRVSMADGLPLRFHGATVRGEFGREAGGSFRRIECRIEGSGSVDGGVAAALVQRAERLCYVHQTLVASVELETVLVLDGGDVLRHRDGHPAVSRATRSPA